MKLSVPYYSQFVDIEDPFWMIRACGAAAFKMVTEFHGVETPDLVTLCNEARDREGYHMTNGWVHDYLVMKAKEVGLQAHRTERVINITDEIISSLDAGNPVIVSVEKRVLEQKRFHIIVIVGYEKGEDSLEGVESNDPFKIKPSSCFYYHEPESTDKTRGAYRMCDMDTFVEYWRGKAIFITK
jgi:hypothetical protein